MGGMAAVLELLGHFSGCEGWSVIKAADLGIFVLSTFLLCQSSRVKTRS